MGARRADAAQLRAQQFWAGKGEYAHVPVRDIAAAWRCSSSGLAAAAALATPLPPSRDGDAALAWAPYALQGARPAAWARRAQRRGVPAHLVALDASKALEGSWRHSSW